MTQWTGPGLPRLSKTFPPFLLFHILLSWPASRSQKLTYFSPCVDRIHSWAKAHAFGPSLPSQQDPNRSQATKQHRTSYIAEDTTTAQHAQVNPSVRAPTAATPDAAVPGPNPDDNNNASEKQPPQQGEKPALLVRMKNGSIRFVGHTKTALCHSWVNVLLIFVPAGIAVEAAGLDPVIIFALNAVAIIPLAGLLSHATECVACRLGDTIGALTNVTFGNAVELIILYASFHLSVIEPS